MVANSRRNFPSEQFDRVDALRVRQRSDAHLKAKSFDSSECFTDREDLVSYGSRIANEQCTLQIEKRFELATRNRRPPTLFANFGEGPGVTWEEFVRCLLIGIRNMAQRVHSDLQLIQRTTGATARLAVEIN